MKKLLLAALLGTLLALSYEPFSLWLLAPFSLAGFIYLLHNQKIWQRFLIGFFFSLSFWLIQVNWLSVLSPIVLVITGAALSFFYAISSSTTIVFNNTKFWALLYALVFLTLESLFNYWPFGGFNWGTIGYISSENSLANLVSVIGVFGLSIFIFLLAVFLIYGYLLASKGGVTAGFVLINCWILLVGFLNYFSDVQSTPEATEVLTVGAVQGNVPRLGLEFNAQRKAVYQNHLNETKKLLYENPEAGFDLIIWPENAPDVDPFANEEIIFELNELAKQAKAPILVRSRIVSSNGPINASILITGETTYENAFYYAKRKLVPFGERVPFEKYLGPIASNFGPISQSLEPGTKVGILELGERLRIGLLICFEVAWGQLAKDVVDNGASVIVVQTNNATYGLTTQLPQQFNIARLRAIESQKPVLTVATSGISGLVDKDGTVLWEADEFIAESKLLQITTYEGQTIGLALNYYLQIIVLSLFVGLFLIFALHGRRLHYVK
ncbi:MAG: apolipoprotein N-acyltransferase [Candidatus Nanopelagicales bacterium]